LQSASAAVRAFAAGEISADEIDTSGWSPHAVVNLVNSIPAGTATERLIELDETLGLSETRNANIARAWFTRVARLGHRPAYPAMEAHLERFGRTWLLRNVYRSLVEKGEGDYARELFDKARAKYHPLTVLAIEPLLTPASAP
jgi:hypothetical protein